MEWGLSFFLELLKFYLQCTFALFNGSYYVQREGICIGSSVSPVLCHIYLAKSDRSIETALCRQVCKVHRYVDDYRVFIKAVGPIFNAKVCRECIDCFQALLCRPKVTYELQDSQYL